MKKLNMGSLLATGLFVVSTMLNGCKVAQTAADVPMGAVRAIAPPKAEPAKTPAVEMQEKLLRFADEYSWRMAMGIEKLQRGTNDVNPAEVLRWKIALSTEINSIVTGPNSLANLLDMAVFVTVTRTALEEHWRPRVFGESVTPLILSCRNAETNIWNLTAKLLTPAQIAELRNATAAWCRDNPIPESVLAARSVNFALEVTPSRGKGAALPSSIFDLVKLDPLAGLDPATREIAETRMFAERALYIAHRMPTILRWQAELLTLNATEAPTVKQLLTNSTQVTASLERAVGVAERLPAHLSSEREAILKTLQGQERDLVNLSAEIRQTLNAGSQMSTSLNATLQTFDQLMVRFGVGATNAGPKDTNAEPFRIRDYERAAVELARTAGEFTELLRTTDRAVASTNLLNLTAQTRTQAERLLNHFFLGVIFTVAVSALVIIAARLLLRRLSRS